MKAPALGRWLPLAFLLALAPAPLGAEEVRSTNAAAPNKALAEALSSAQWSQVEICVDRSLAWLDGQQRPDGSFPTQDTGQPAVTSLCVMAFLSRGHLPGFGPYGQQLNRAIDYALSCQDRDGLFSRLAPEPEFVGMGASHTAAYDHAITGLMLGEVYGHVTGARAKKVRAAIGKAIVYTRALQDRAKPYPSDVGGWRYVRRKPSGNDADLSITAWQLMFLRSARNAEFNVPQRYVDEGVAYVRRCWNAPDGMFYYVYDTNGDYDSSRGTTGAGILSLSLAGEHNTEMARAAGDWLVRHPFNRFGETIGPWDRFYYSIYYCSQAAAQLGGRYWAQIFPPIATVLLRAQQSNGSFPREQAQGDSVFGSTYTTAMAVLSLTPAYQLLPVYQR